MKTAERYISENLDIKVPNTKTINGKWFLENSLPMIVECCCCETTMNLFSSFINDDGEIFCHSCANDN